MEGKMAEQDSKGDACAATVMREGDFVILKTEKTARMVQLRAEHPVFVDKRKIECTDIIGRPWEQVNGKEFSCVVYYCILSMFNKTDGGTQFQLLFPATLILYWAAFVSGDHL